jgi:hypothetical protein
MVAVRNLLRSVVLSAAALVPATAWLSASPAHATVVVVPTLEEMTLRCDVVVHAVVREVESSEEPSGRLITLTTLEVLDGVSGAKAGDVLTVFQVGGAANGRVAWVAGAHHFVVGEELVFFGVQPPALKGRVVPYGIGFGLFRIVDGVDGRHVEEISGDVAQLVKTPDGNSHMAPVTPRRFDALDGFKAQLRSVIAGRPATLPQLRRINGPPAPPALRRAADTTTATTSTTER